MQDLRNLMGACTGAQDGLMRPRDKILRDRRKEELSLMKQKRSTSHQTLYVKQLLKSEAETQQPCINRWVSIGLHRDALHRIRLFSNS